LNALKEVKVPDQSQLMLTTERLRFETWRPEDHKLLFELHADPRVQTSYAPGPHKWTMAGIDRRLNGYMEEQENFGFTKWKLSLSDGTFIGRAGWSPWKEAALEIGYAIKPQFWNNGYASEAAQALVTWARAHRPNDSLVGYALPHNETSRRILERIGMEFVDYRDIAGAEFAFYEIKTRDIVPLSIVGMGGAKISDVWREEIILPQMNRSLSARLAFGCLQSRLAYLLKHLSFAHARGTGLCEKLQSTLVLSLGGIANFWNRFV
jgi:[ribosomal protein S5]-alanine N-acetyltransferase